ncbi:MAG TPA: uroporphyrinogen-III synthase [Blastocatellia bacterium]|nr:uroporphyrinogen-III synthase [Blastocatellia bacterium]
MPDSDHFSGPPLDAAGGRPLAGKTLMLTRPPAQSAEMAANLERLGATVIHCPTIEVVAPASWERLDAAIAGLENYDWLIFTSANGVEFFFRRLIEKRQDGLSVVSRLQTCAVGPATARAIVTAGGRVDLTAKNSTGEGVLAALIEAVGGEARLAGLRFLLPRARVAREVLPAELARCGAQVDAVEAYQTVRPDLDREALMRWIAESRVDAIAFTSPSTVNNFAALVGADDLAERLRGIVVASIGPVTSDALRAHGLSEIVQPQTYNAAALVDTLVEALTQD